ncbi:MAG: hypothetical protein AAFY42_07955 [Pseudomonadota bacterium]
MALNKPQLVIDLVAAFTAHETDENWSATDAANALADAIEAYVKSADVIGVITEVRNPGGDVIGTGTQNNEGELT